MDRRGPLADSYVGAAALVVCALVPFLALAAALAPPLCADPRASAVSP